MFRYIELWFGLLTRCLQSHRSLLLENLVLRQQLAVLKRKHPRPRMGAVDRIFSGIRPPFLGCVEAVSGAGQSGDGRWLASRWFSPVLELDLEGEKTARQEKTVAGSSGAETSV